MLQNLVKNMSKVTAELCVGTREYLLLSISHLSAENVSICICVNMRNNRALGMFTCVVGSRFFSEVFIKCGTF